LTFDNNFGKCRPIFKFSIADSHGNCLCNYCRAFPPDGQTWRQHNNRARIPSRGKNQTYDR